MSHKRVLLCTSCHYWGRSCYRKKWCMQNGFFPVYQRNARTWSSVLFSTSKSLHQHRNLRRTTTLWSFLTFPKWEAFVIHTSVQWAARKVISKESGEKWKWRKQTYLFKHHIKYLYNQAPISLPIGPIRSPMLVMHVWCKKYQPTQDKHYFIAFKCIPSQHSSTKPSGQEKLYKTVQFWNTKVNSKHSSWNAHWCVKC